MPDPRRLSNVGGWREGDPPAWRQFIDVGSVALEFGGSLPNVKVAYETLGTPRYEHGEIVNAVLVLHALTGDAHISGDPAPGQPTAGWWRALIGPGRAVDTDRWFVVSSNVLGGCQGTTGPSSLAPDGHAWGSRFPEITIRDQVAVEVRLADRLGVRKWASVLGGSMGGMRALEWLVGQPDRVASGFILATGAAASADQIGTQTTQIAAITGDPEWHGGDYYDAGDGPITGLGLARRIAHLTYRTGEELEQRFGRQRQDDRAEVFAVQSYLDHHASKLARRFDAGSYVTLTQAMNTHDVGRGRGGVRSALESIRCPVIVAGIESDRLYPLAQQAEIADATPGCAALDVIISPYGHDAFLIEAEAVGGLLGKLL